MPLSQEMVYLVYARDLHDEVEPFAMTGPGEVRILAPHELGLLFKSFPTMSLTTRVRLRRWSRSKQTTILVCADGEQLLHHTVIREGPQRIGYLPIGENEIHIGPCVTETSARGRRIYPHVLCTAMSHFRSRGCTRAILRVWDVNVSSIKGVEHAGFTQIGVLRYRRILRYLKFGPQLQITGTPQLAE